MTYEQCKSKIESIQQDLLKMGFDWDFIQLFWDDCIKQAKQKTQ